MSGKSPISRRSAVKGLGALAVAGGAGAGGIMALTGAGVAVSQFKVNGDDSTFELNDGHVDAVVIDASGKITWDGLDHDAESATVLLEAENKDGNWKTAVEKVIDFNAKNRKSGSQEFDLAPVDLTTLGGLGDAYFSAGEDGDTQERHVGLRITVTVDTSKEGYSVSSSTGATLDTTVLNEPKSTAGSAEADTYDAYAGPIYEQQETETSDEARLFIKYGAEKIIMQMDLREYISRMSDGAKGKHLNAAIGMDVDEDNVGDYQFGWLPKDDGNPEFSVKEGDLGGWSGWIGADNRDYVLDYSYQNGIVTFKLDRDALGIEPDDTYLTGFFASAGGEEEYVAVSDDPPKFWSSENNSTSSEYWIQAVAE